MMFLWVFATAEWKYDRKRCVADADQLKLESFKETIFDDEFLKKKLKYFDTFKIFHPVDPAGIAFLS